MRSNSRLAGRRRPLPAAGAAGAILMRWSGWPGQSRQTDAQSFPPAVIISCWPKTRKRQGEIIKKRQGKDKEKTWGRHGKDKEKTRERHRGRRGRVFHSPGNCYCHHTLSAARGRCLASVPIYSSSCVRRAMCPCDHRGNPLTQGLPAKAPVRGNTPTFVPMRGHSIRTTDQGCAENLCTGVGG